jgi:hypothetical protein
VYTALRAALFAGCLALGWLAGLGGVLLLAAALVASGLLSWFLLDRQRAALGLAAERAVSAMRARAHERTAREDAYVDSVLAGGDAERR